MQFTQKYGPTTFRCQGAVFPLDHGSINLRRNLVQDLSKSKIEKSENFAGIHRPCGNLPVGNYMKLPSVQICNHPWATNDSKNQASSVVQCMAETIGQRCDRLPRPHNIPQRLWPWQSSLEFPSIFNNIQIFIFNIMKTKALEEADHYIIVTFRCISGDVFPRASPFFALSTLRNVNVPRASSSNTSKMFVME